MMEQPTWRLPIAYRRPAALAALVIAYAARPVSCSYTLTRYSVTDNVPYAPFDAHGISASYGLIGALACFYPVFWLARRLIPTGRDAATSPGGRVTGVSALVAVAIAMPSFAQIDYIRGLPLVVMWPVVASAMIWPIVVATVWLTCLRSARARLAMAAVRYQAIGIALLVTIPKLVLLAV